MGRGREVDIRPCGPRGASRCAALAFLDRIPFLFVIGLDGARMGCQDALMKAAKQILPVWLECTCLWAPFGGFWGYVCPVCRIGWREGN